MLGSWEQSNETQSSCPKTLSRSSLLEIIARSYVSIDHNEPTKPVTTVRMYPFEFLTVAQYVFPRPKVRLSLHLHHQRVRPLLVISLSSKCSTRESNQLIMSFSDKGSRRRLYEPSDLEAFCVDFGLEADQADAQSFVTRERALTPHNPI